MSEVSVMREVPVAATALRGAIEGTLQTMVSESREGRVSLTAPLGALSQGRLADVGVPIEVVYQPGAAAPIELRARTNDALFPRFCGAIAVDAVAPSRSTVRLHGEYQVPLGIVGQALDKAAFAGIAERSLSAFLDQLVQAARTRLANEAEAAIRASRLT